MKMVRTPDGIPAGHAPWTATSALKGGPIRRKRDYSDASGPVAFGEVLSVAETSRGCSTGGMGARRERVAESLDRMKVITPHLGRSDDD